MPSKIAAAAACALTAIVLSACSSSDASSDAPDDAAKASPDVRMTVSPKSTCTFLMDLESAEPMLLQRVVDVVLKAQDGSFDEDDIEEVRDVATDLEVNADAAPKDMREYVVTLHKTMTDILKSIEGGGGDAVNIGGFRMAQEELLNRCKTELEVS